MSNKSLSIFIEYPEFVYRMPYTTKIPSNVEENE